MTDDERDLLIYGVEMLHEREGEDGYYWDGYLRGAIDALNRTRPSERWIFADRSGVREGGVQVYRYEGRRRE